MLDKDQIDKIVEDQIEKDEQIGSATGGSGHLSQTNYNVDSVQSKIIGDGIEIIYRYTIFIETEFTIYPDNPPYEYHHECVIFVAENGKVTKLDHKTSGGPNIDEWIPEGE